MGTVTSVGLSSATSGVTIGSSPITTSGTITLAIATATTSQNGLLSSTDWATFNAKQNTITLTTTGTSGASTLVGATLNIPNYGSALTGYVPYTGATGTVNLGAYDLTVNNLTIGKGTSALSNNSALGYRALFHITTGNYNTAVGYESAHNTTTGQYNTALGQSALFTNTTGSQNTALGLNALLNNTTGGSNVVVGLDALQHNTTGGSNTALGYNAGSHITGGATPNTTASNSIYIGRDTRANVNGGANEIVIGNTVTGNGSNTVTIGNSSITANYFKGSINADSFVKSGGTSSQFLKADGTVDSNTYALDSAVVHNTGNETIGGTKTFSDATKNNGGIFLQNASSNSLAGYMNLGGLTNGVKFTSGGGVSNTFTLPSATGYTFTFPNATGTIALTSDISYPVTSVFGRTGAVVATSGDYTTAQVTESGNLYFTDSRARLALSFVAGSGAYNNTTGVITIPTNNNQITNGAGYTTNVGTVTSVAATGGTGISITGSPITTSGTITITNTAPDQTVALTASTGISVTGTYPNFTITNTSPSSGGTVTSVAALTIGTTGTDLSSSVANSTTTPVITLNVPTASATNRGALSSADWSTFNSKQGTITLTTTGTSGAATFTSNTLNIPNYGSALSGYLPLTGGTLTGALGGTSASFSTTITSGGNINSGDSVTLLGELYWGGTQSGQKTRAYTTGSSGSATLNYSFWTGSSWSIVSTLTSGGAANFIGSISAYNFSGTSSGTNTGDQDLSGYVTLATTQTISGAKTFTSVLTITANASANALALNGRSSDNTSSIDFFQNNGTTRLMEIGISPSAAEFYYDASSPMIFYTAGTERTRIWGSTGNVNIGTTPASDSGYKLDVNGTGRFKLASDRNLAIKYDSNITLSAQADAGAPESLRMYADTFRIYTATTAAGLTERFTIASTGAATFSSSVKSTQYLIAPSGTSAVYNIVDSDQSYAGSYNLQAGGGSSGYGGSLVMFGHSHATKPGYVVAGISAGSGGKFTVNNNGNGGGTELFSVDINGVALFSSSVTATSFFESSDSRLKTLIQDNYQTKGIASITPKLYTKNGKVELGYYAQDFVGVLDSAVSKGSDDMLSLSYREVHTAKIYALEQEIKELKAKMN